MAVLGAGGAASRETTGAVLGSILPFAEANVLVSTPELATPVMSATSAYVRWAAVRR